MKTTVAIVGLGSRGRITYAPFALLHPDKMEITAAADIDPGALQETAGTYHIPKERCFASAEELAAGPSQDGRCRLYLHPGPRSRLPGAYRSGKRIPHFDGKTHLPRSL